MSVSADKLTELDRTCKKTDDTCCVNPNTTGSRATGFGDGSSFVSFHGGVKQRSHDGHLGATEEDDDILRDYCGLPISGSRWRAGW